jgi:hypothetical protein
MNTAKKYTWTVSILAMLDRSEVIGKKMVQWDAYNELEESITCINRANKDIEFTIYLYDVKDKRAYIKKSAIVKEHYVLNLVHFEDIEDFYVPGYPHLVNFFKDHVAKTNINPDQEEHKHLLLIWGHAAGLGFLKQQIEKDSEKPLNESLMLTSKSDLKGLASQVELQNFVRSHILMPDKLLPQVPSLLNKIAGTGNKLHMLSSAFMLTNQENFKVISAIELNAILRDGLAADKSTCTVDPAVGTPIPTCRIQIMLCLSCYVNMAETAYSLREMVNVYVAPTTQISHFGYNYYKLFKLLAREPKASEKELAVNITDYYLAKYRTKGINRLIKDDRIFGINYKDAVCFSASYLHLYDGPDGVLARIKKFKNDILSLPEVHGNIPTILRHARRKCRPTSYYGRDEIGIIDYHNFITEVFSSLKGLRASFPFHSYYPQKQIISRYYPGLLCDSRYDTVINKFVSQSAGSFSIFLPSTGSSIENNLRTLYLSSVNGNDFLQKTEWDQIIAII